MKELSIEEKAKRYEKAIKRAKELLEIGVKDTRDKKVVLSFFPELKESEDEKVIRDIKVVLECSATKFFKEEGKMPIWYDRAVAWLEKQGEQKPTWSEENEHRVKDAIYFLDTAKKHYASTVEIDACIDWIKSIKQRLGG